jgi:hypothetical protein
VFVILEKYVHRKCRSVNFFCSRDDATRPGNLLIRLRLRGRRWAARTFMRVFACDGEEGLGTLTRTQEKS